MGHQGRFGKYGELKRIERLRAGRDTRMPYALGKGPGQDKPWAPWKRKEPAQALIRIRPARSEEGEYVLAISREAFAPFGDYEGVLSAWFDREETITLIAQREERRLGFAMLGIFAEGGHVPGTAELLAIAVSPGSRRRGIGSRLLEEALAVARQRRVATMLLHTALENVAAQRLFSAFGFRAVETKEHFYPKGQDAVLMYREIGKGSVP
jgi:ribosomal-protein-alanine N-acetyltransferase